MRSFCLPLAVLLIAIGHSNAQSAAEAAMTVSEGAPLTVECTLRVEQRVEWRLGGGAVPADMRPAGEAAGAGGGGGGGGGGRLTARLHAPAARAHHAGLYSCSRDPDAQRVRVRVRAASPVSGTAATEAATEVTTTAKPKNRILREQYWFDLNGNIELNCSSAVPVDTNGMKYVWRKNGTLVEQVLDLKGRYEVVEGHVFRLTERAHEDDYGDYACEDPAGGELRAWDVRAHVRAYLPENTNVVEGQKLRLLCKLKGKPYPPVRWTFSNATSAENASGVPVEELGERVETRVSEQGAELVVAAAQRADAGHWGCVPEAPGALGDVTTVRVKDMYAALWPFLGICVEVFVLCAIILVYEKRRTKPEQDDSDTENHDQKKS